MMSTETSQQIISENLAPPLGGFDYVEDDQVQAEEPTGLKRLTRRSQGTCFGLVFLAGLLLGWLVIGWWLWPVQWTNSKPWLLTPEHQRTFIGLVADEYWHTRDISRARGALAGWGDEALTNLLATMQSQTSSAEERQHLATLAEALALPAPTASLLTSLLDHKGLILSTVLSAAPLVTAVILAVAPLVRNRRKEPEAVLGQGIEDLEEELEKLLAQGEEQQAQEGEEGEEEKETGNEEEEDEENREDEDGDDDEWLDEEVEGEDPLVGNILSSIFEEDNETLMVYQALCKDLEDIDVNDLVQKSQGIIDQLVRSNMLRQP
jgi:hypothetical protein